MPLDGATLSMVLSLHSNTRTIGRIKGLDKKHFLIRRVRRHLVIPFRVANVNKQISQVY
jgi:hypothetical protein